MQLDGLDRHQRLIESYKNSTPPVRGGALTGGLTGAAAGTPIAAEAAPTARARTVPPKHQQTR